MQLFYSTEVGETEIIISGEEHQHLGKSLRKKVGDQIYVTDGLGHLYTTQLTDKDRHETRLKIISKKYQEKRKAALEMAISPLKNVSRLEWFLEKVTEIGIDVIHPISCDHSEKTSLRTERAEKIIISAMKQSLRCHKPILKPVVTIEEVLSTHISQKIIAATAEKKQLIYQYTKAAKDTLILIGPEGGFSEREVQLAVSQDFSVVSLGPARLRSETAGVVACQIFAQANDV